MGIAFPAGGRLAWPAVALLVSVGLMACASAGFTANVLRFSDLSAAPSGGSFAVAPEPGQDASMEFRLYANIVASRLQQLGFRQTTDAEQADLVVKLAYGIDSGRVEVWSTPIYPAYGWPSGPIGPWPQASGVWPSGPIGPWPPLPLAQSDVHSVTVFTHHLDLKIVDGGKLRQGGQKEVFQGRAVAERPTADTASSVPYLIEAMFDNFPGPSGTPITVTIPQATLQH